MQAGRHRRACDAVASAKARVGHGFAGAPAPAGRRSKLGAIAIVPGNPSTAKLNEPPQDRVNPMLEIQGIPDLAAACDHDFVVPLRVLDADLRL
jgi:hypothetical protein